MESEKERGKCIMLMEEYMTGNGKIIKWMDKVFCISKKGKNAMKENFVMTDFINTAFYIMIMYKI